MRTRIPVVGGMLAALTVTTLTALGGASAEPGTPVDQARVVPVGYVNGDAALGADGTAFYPASSDPSSTARDAVFALRRPGGAWQGPLRVTPAGTHTGDIVGGVDRTGLVWLAWTRLGTAATPDRGLYVRSIAPDGTRSTPVRLSQAAVVRYDLDVNDRGDVAIVWRQFGADALDTGTFVRRRPAGGGWLPTSRLGSGGDLARPQVELSAAGDVFTLWGEDSATVPGQEDLLARIHSATADAWQPEMALGTSLPNSDLPPDLVVSSAGHAVFSWPEGGRFWSPQTGLGPFETELAVYPHAFVIEDSGVVHRYRAQNETIDPVTERVRNPGGAWSEPIVVLDDVASVPDAAIDASGAITLTVWTSGVFEGGAFGNGRRVLRAAPGGSMIAGPMIHGFNEYWVDPLAVTARGDGIVVGSENAFDFDVAQSVATGLDVTGPTVVPGPLPRWNLKTQASLDWSATDVWSLGGSVFTVRRQSAGPDEAFGTETETTTPQSPANVPTDVGTTTCFRVTGTDGADNVGAPSSRVCTSSPVDDRGLQASPGWTTPLGSGFYRGTVSTTTRNGARLSLPVTTRRLALVATTCPDCGTVDVFLGGTKLKRISLAASRTRNKVVVPVATFGSLRSGTVRIEVASAGKRVSVDGLGSSRS